MPARRTVVRSTLLSFAAAAASIVACSSSPPGDVDATGKTAEALWVPTCSGDEIVSCGTYDYGHGVANVCTCQTFVTPNSGICAEQNVTPPSGLPNCKVGFWAGDDAQELEPVWACPTEYEGVLPSRIGLVGTEYPVCVDNPDGGEPAQLPCVEVLWIDGFDPGGCILTPPTNWGFVWEHVLTTCCFSCCARDSRGWCVGGGGCPGPCALKP